MVNLNEAKIRQEEVKLEEGTFNSCGLIQPGECLITVSSVPHCGYKTHRERKSLVLCQKGR